MVKVVTAMEEVGTVVGGLKTMPSLIASRLLLYKEYVDEGSCRVCLEKWIDEELLAALWFLLLISRARLPLTARKISTNLIFMLAIPIYVYDI